MCVLGVGVCVVFFFFVCFCCLFVCFYLFVCFICLFVCLRKQNEMILLYLQVRKIIYLKAKQYDLI